jgi:anti-anti-sigma factor
MSTDTSPNVRVETVDGVTIVTPTVPLSAEMRDELYQAAAGIAAAEAPRWVVLSLEPIRQINSAAIGILVNFQKRVREAGGLLKVADIAPNILDIFLLTKMDQVLDLAKTRQAAIAAFQGKTRSGSSGEESGGSWMSRIFGGK